jgi:hypothetical protein
MTTKFSFNRILILVGLLILVLAIGAWAVGLARAQDVTPPREAEDPAALLSTSHYIPLQGQLTDASGNPLNGVYSVAFRIYGQSTGGTALCEDVRSLTLEDGLFSTYIYGGDCSIDGRALYLGVEVGTDGEMTPRQYIDNVPVAWTLRPGATISGTLANSPILHLENWASDGRGLRAYAMSETGVNYGVAGASRSPDGFGGYFYNNEGGTALYASSDTGTTFRAGGSGIIQSTAPTYLWVSGNDVRPYNQTDSTIINLDSIGGAYIERGATAGNKNVMLPITLAGTLYGQPARVTALDIYWVGETDFDGIVHVLMRRQTGVCATISCYLNILSDPTDRICDIGNNPTGCVTHFDLTTNNVLTADSGVLYLTLELGFSGASTYIELGGIRLTLEYDN